MVLQVASPVLLLPLSPSHQVRDLSAWQWSVSIAISCCISRVDLSIDLSFLDLGGLGGAGSGRPCILTQNFTATQVFVFSIIGVDFYVRSRLEFLGRVIS